MSLFNFLNIRNTVIVILLMLSANSNTCVSSGLVQIDCLFFSLWIVFSCMPHNLSLNGERPPDIVNFTLLGSGHFLYSYKYSQTLLPAK